MAKLALALLAAPAVAFNFGGGGGAPARAAVDTTADIGVDPGPIEPTGPFWEDQEGLARRRAVEIKHGRIAMMAFIGMIVEELGVTFPGSINLDGSVQFADILKDGMGFALCGNQPVSLEPTRSRGQRRVDGVESPRHRADAATGTTPGRWRGAPEI